MTVAVAQGGAFHDIYWPDTELNAVEIGFDTLALRVRETTGKTIRVISEGYLGHEHVGVGDEIIIERAELRAQGAFLDRCFSDIKRRLGSARTPSGSEARKSGAAMQLTLTFIDRSQLYVVLKSLRVERA